MKLFLQSFQFKKDFWKLLSYDILYYAVFLGMLAVYKYLGLSKLKSYKLAVELMQGLQTKTSDLPLEYIVQQAQSLTAELMQFIWITLFLVLVLVVNYSFFKSFIWSKLLEKKYSVATFVDALVANVLFLSIAGVILYFTGSYASEDLMWKLMLFYLVVGIYFINIIHPVLQLEQSVVLKNAVLTAFVRPFVLFGKSLWYGIAYVYRIILPFLAMVGVFIVLIILFNLIKSVLPFSYSIVYYLYLVFLFLVTLIYLTWCKQYMKMVLTER